LVARGENIMADRFNEYAAEFQRNPSAGWPAAQKAVDERHAPPEPAPRISEFYMRGLSGDEAMEQVFAYQRRANVPIEQAAAAYGLEFSEDRPAQLNASGLVAAEPQHYACADDPVSEDTIIRMLAAAADDGFSLEEVRELERLIRAGNDPTDSYVRISTRLRYSEREKMKPSPLHPHESTVKAPEHETAGEGGVDGGFMKDLGSMTLAAPEHSLTGAYNVHHHPPRPGGKRFAQAFPDPTHGGEMRTQHVTDPEGEPASPYTRDRVSVHYQRGGAVDNEAARRRRFDLPGRPCLGFTSQRCADGGTIEHPVYT
jgi:hypothetical protein